MSARTVTSPREGDEGHEPQRQEDGEDREAPAGTSRCSRLDRHPGGVAVGLDRLDPAQLRLLALDPHVPEEGAHALVDRDSVSRQPAVEPAKPTL